MSAINARAGAPRYPLWVPAAERAPPPLAFSWRRHSQRPPGDPPPPRRGGVSGSCGRGTAEIAANKVASITADGGCRCRGGSRRRRGNSHLDARRYCSGRCRGVGTLPAHARRAAQCNPCGICEGSYGACMRGARGAELGTRLWEQRAWRRWRWRWRWRRRRSGCGNRHGGRWGIGRGGKG